MKMKNRRKQFRFGVYMLSRVRMYASCSHRHSLSYTFRIGNIGLCRKIRQR